MAESKPLPVHIDECQAEIAELGFRLSQFPARGGRSAFVIVAANAPDHPIERFESELWSDIECAQAAVRFARYFLNGDSKASLAP